jgi:glycosyltransferase involved in cell wall biosynthesis
MLNNVDVNCFYVPHAIEKVFKPTEKIVLENKDVLDTREFLGLPKDAFVVGMNAANKGTSPSRKAFAENFLAFSLFARKHSDAILYLHTDPTPAAGGLDLISLLKAVGLKDTQYRFVDTYLYRTFINQETLASIYTEMDVLLATSFGEGFGIPTVEAQACGTPVIASNFMASQE